MNSFQPRESTDIYSGSRLMDGYDYHNQAWVTAGKYVACGHPQSMHCNCYGRKHAGCETVVTGREVTK